MILIGGWGKKTKKIADAGLIKCKNCNNTAAFEIRELANTASAFFIPVAKWNKKNYLICPICTAGYELSDDDKNKLLQEVATLPNNEIATSIWNELDALFVDFMNEKKDLEEWNKTALEKLEQKYKRDDLEYVLASFNQNLLESVNNSTE